MNNMLKKLETLYHSQWKKLKIQLTNYISLYLKKRDILICSTTISPKPLWNLKTFFLET